MCVQAPGCLRTSPCVCVVNEALSVVDRHPPYICLYTRLYACLYTRLYACLYTRLYACLYTCLCACDSEVTVSRNAAWKICSSTTLRDPTASVVSVSAVFSRICSIHRHVHGHAAQRRVGAGQNHHNESVPTLLLYAHTYISWRRIMRIIMPQSCPSTTQHDATASGCVRQRRG